MLSRKPTEAVTTLPAYYFLSKVSVTGLRAEAGLVRLWESVGCCSLGPLLGAPEQGTGPFICQQFRVTSETKL